MGAIETITLVQIHTHTHKLQIPSVSRKLSTKRNVFRDMQNKTYIS